MSFDWLLILIPVVLAIGALVRVLTLKSPDYQRKRKEYRKSSASGNGTDASSSDPASGHSKMGQDSHDSSSDSGSDGGGGGD
jgi:hypothetical protein